MSTPNRRASRSSANNTPSSRRSQRSNASQAPPPPSSDAAAPEEDADAANSQLLSEAGAAGTTPRASQRSQRASARGTPRASQQSQAPPTSSPLFFRSSPAGSQSQSQSQGLGVPAANGSVQGSSPLRQRNDARIGSSDGGRTPRGAPGIGGKLLYHSRYRPQHGTHL